MTATGTIAVRNASKGVLSRYRRLYAFGCGVELVVCVTCRVWSGEALGQGPPTRAVAGAATHPVRLRPEDRGRLECVRVCVCDSVLSVWSSVCACASVVSVRSVTGECS